MQRTSASRDGILLLEHLVILVSGGIEGPRFFWDERGSLACLSEGLGNRMLLGYGIECSVVLQVTVAKDGVSVVWNFMSDFRVLEIH